MKKSLIIFFGLVLFLASNSFAVETPWQDSSAKKEGAIRFISGGYTDKNIIYSGLHIKFSDNWKTYWKDPGDSGLAVTPDFSRSENIKKSEMLWPVPERHLFYDLEGWGYGKEVVLPVVSEVVDITKPARLVAKVKWAICDENCIFVENEMSVTIPADYYDEAALGLIQKYNDMVPVRDGGVKLASVVASDKAVVAEFDSSEGFAEDVDLFIIEDSKNFRFPRPVITRSGDGKRLSVWTNYEVLKKGESLAGKSLELTLRNGNKGFVVEHRIGTEELTNGRTEEKKEQTNGVIPAKAGIQPEGEAGADGMDSRLRGNDTTSTTPQITLTEAIIAAILGGLILNIMPCVLPVLLLKIFGIIKHGAADRKFIRRNFAFTVAGIIFSFLVIAIFVVTLKSLGHAIGWGIQFQQQEFLIFLSVVLTLFAANQFGWMDVALPRGISDKINNRLNLSGDATPLGNFLTGAFATLLATPCTAPYLATAISFSFASDSFTIMLIFFFMGVGLAMPYLLIMASPSFVKIFPRPGRWMRIVRIILGVLLFLTNLWIFWIFLTNGGPNAGFMLLVCNILMAVWLLVAHLMKLDRTKTFFTVIWMVICTFGITLYLADMEREPEEMKGAWVMFDRAGIDKYVAEGKVVYVDVTAEWCLTCKFNEANVIYPMKGYFDENGVVMMKADYTSPSKPVNDLLVEYGAYGIPLNLIYGPNAKAGIKLPVLVKERDIRTAVEKAR